LYASTELAAKARQTLQNNDRGGYTLPTDGLYPFQWNWDAGISALGWLGFDPQRAWQEFHTLFKGMWTAEDFGGANAGFLAHIIFHQDSDSYFPGPDQWGTQSLKLRTSSISQPPVHATMLRWMLEASTAPAERQLAMDNLRVLVPQLLAHHDWWYRCRDPQGTGLVVNIHPWETGMDNSPAWDGPLAAVPGATRPYVRRDLQHVDASMRPPKSFYDRVVYLMDFNQQVGFDPARIMAECPYRVNDIGIISILQRASQDLAALCSLLGMEDAAERLRQHVARTHRAVEALWSERWQQYVSRNAITGELLEAPTSAGLLATYAGFARPVANTVRQWLAETAYGLPSARASANGFEPRRYWRGPVWQHINMLIAKGFEGTDEALARQIQQASLALVQRTGFHEYYDPLTGDGLGGAHFSWTAATYLFWLHTD
jgi:hypothetical protein